MICASTGNTSASAAAYATAAGMTCAVLVPEGKIAMGKLSQAIAHGATLLQVDGNFDDCLTLARKLAEAYPVELVNSVNPARIEGQKTGGLRGRGRARRRARHPLPAGRQRRQHHRVLEGLHASTRVDADLPGPATRTPRMWGFQAAGAAPIVAGPPGRRSPTTIATAIRIGNPASWRQAEQARDESGGVIEAVTDAADPGRAPAAVRPGGRVRGARLGGQRRRAAAGARGRAGRRRAQTVVCTVTGHGLKDPQWALRKDLDGVEVSPVRVPVDAFIAPRPSGSRADRGAAGRPARTGRARGARARHQRQPRPRASTPRPGARICGHLLVR